MGTEGQKTSEDVGAGAQPGEDGGLDRGRWGEIRTAGEIWGAN